jgi:signal transduction histidine kinase/HAMP domain-containing protein/CheY-like chemotaxis protein
MATGVTAQQPTASVADDELLDVLNVLASLCAGNFSARAVPLEGVAGQVVERVNQLAMLHERRTRELVWAGQVIGREGRTTERVDEVGSEGDWSTGAAAVNSLIDDLVRPTTEVARVIAAVAEGDLSQQMALDIAGQPVKGEFLRIGTTVNTMVDELSSFADEVTRVAREVGTEGKLGGQAQVRGVSGVWHDLTESVNSMAGNLTSQVRNIAQVTTAVAQGDLSQKITVDALGEILELKSTINTMVDQLSSFADEVTRVAREVGTEGKLGGQAQVKGVSGTWKDLTDNVNFMAGNLTSQVRNIAQIATAVARGDLSQKITVDAKGEVAKLAKTLNTMVDQLSSFADEVTRVAREVGTEGKLAGQAEVKGVSGTWKDLTDNVNFMASNLTSQVRNIALVTTAVAQGDLSQKITVDAQGEILDLKSTVNTMVDQLSAFAAEVTRVAREVGTEGKLGGQAKVADVSGTWRHLTENVNQLAGNLTTQVRAIAEVSTAVTNGDLTRSVNVEAQGEVAELKDNVNQMIANLRSTTEINAQQDWLKSSLARIGGKLQGQRDLDEVTQMIMSEVTPVVNAVQGVFYLADSPQGRVRLRRAASYGAESVEDLRVFHVGEGLIGQAAMDKRPIRVRKVPHDHLRVRSGLGVSAPADLFVLPVLFEEQVLGVIELASFSGFDELHATFLQRFVETIGVVLNTIIANVRTEELLGQSQRLAQELQVQSVELQRTNAELEDKARLLTEQSTDLEIKNCEIELARLGLEDKAEQLALSSQYKSEFLANMSHELRTPLNSLLILAKLLADNSQNNLSDKEIEFARSIHNAGSDLLSLINDILDLSKVEAGKMDVRPAAVVLAEVCDYVGGNFGPLAEQQGLELVIELEDGLPEYFVTDEQRLQQVLKNLLSNALKFTASGRVCLSVHQPPSDTVFATPTLDDAEAVVAFSVADTGIGVPPEKLKLIFEAFQQADGTTSRRYGGSGLGLSISREIARVLGGALTVKSETGQGSTFTLFVPVTYPYAADGALPTPDGATGAVLDAPMLTRQSMTHQAERLAAGSDPLQGATVLVVDDDVRNVFALTSALELHGMQVLYADNGGDGIALLTRRPDIDLVLMDVMMPGMDGNEATERIRRMPQYAELPIVFLTARAMPGDRDRSLAAGASEYVTKPVDLDRLLAVMRSWLAPRSDQRT